MPYLKKPSKPYKASKAREARQQIYRQQRWKDLRKAKLIQNPLCEICLQKGIVTPATQVHHIDSFSNYEGNERLYKAFDFNNLQSICVQCHSRLHSEGKNAFTR